MNMRRLHNNKIYSLGFIVFTCFLILLYLYTQTRSTSFTKLNINETSCFTAFRNHAEGTPYSYLPREDTLPDLPSHLIIQDENSYQNLNKYRNPTCNTSLPFVDFNKETILGNFSHGKCGARFTERVERNDKHKTITFAVTIDEQTCRSGAPHWSMNLISVPKIPADYEVKFVTK